MWRVLGEPAHYVAVEMGAGDGQLRSQIVGFLRAREPSCATALRYVAIDRFGSGNVVADAMALPLGRVVGCVLSNEMFDALPVHRLVDGAEQWVVERDGHLHLEAGTLSNAALAADMPGRPDQVVDVAPAAPQIIAEIDRVLQR